MTAIITECNTCGRTSTYFDSIEFICERCKHKEKINLKKRKIKMIIKPTLKERIKGMFK